MPRPTLTGEAHELAALLAELGLPRPQALVCLFLAANGESTSRDLEDSLELRQPEVSVATRELRRTEWVAARSVKGEGKGRPVNHYRLRVTLADIVARLEAQKRQELRIIEKRLEEARRLAREIPDPRR